MLCHLCVFFFKQKTAYEMRISDWSSDVCSSDLANWSNFSDHSPAIMPSVPMMPQDSTAKISTHRMLWTGRRTKNSATSHTQAPTASPRAIDATIGRASCRESVCQYV